MFDGRIVVESPGKLPGLVKTNNIRHTHFSRNPKIAEREIYFKKNVGGMPELIEGIVFEIINLLTAVSFEKVGPSQSNLVTDQVIDQVNSYGNDMYRKSSTFFTRKYLFSIIQEGKLQMTQLDKLNSSNQNNVINLVVVWYQ